MCCCTRHTSLSESSRRRSKLSPTVLFKHDFCESRPSSEGLDWCICVLHPYVYYIHMFVTFICVLHPYVYYILCITCMCITSMCITSICVCMTSICVLHPYLYQIQCMYVCVYVCAFINGSSRNLTKEFESCVCVCVCVCAITHRFF